MFHDCTFTANDLANAFFDLGIKQIKVFSEDRSIFGIYKDYPIYGYKVFGKWIFIMCLPIITFRFADQTNLTDFAKFLEQI